MPMKREPSLAATALELAFPGAMVWMTSLQPSVSNAQAVHAADASGA